MKAISLWQPWASLIAVGAKQIETRPWLTPHRGPLVIHAAKKLVSECGEDLDEICLDEFGCHWRAALPRGAIVAVVDLVACEPASLGKPSDRERACGNFAEGRFAWLLQNVRPLKRPIPYRGMQRLFNIPESVVAVFRGVR